MVSLSKRMEIVASMVTKGNRMADIGTDHGYVPIALVQRGNVKRAIAMDVRTGPLSKARQHIEEYGLQDNIEIRLSDGMQQLQEGEVDTILIAGMGGELITHILQDGAKKLHSIKEIIVQPQSEIYKVRKELHKLGFRIIEEKMFLDEEKYYVAIKATKGQESYDTEWDYVYGKRLLEQRDETLYEWLRKEYAGTNALCEKLKHISSESGIIRRRELLHKKEVLEGGLAYYETTRLNQ